MPENQTRLEKIENFFPNLVKPIRARIDGLQVLTRTDPNKRGFTNRLRQLRNFFVITLPIQAANLVIKTVALTYHIGKSITLGLGYLSARITGNKELATARASALKKSVTNARETGWNLIVATAVCGAVAGTVISGGFPAVAATVTAAVAPIAIPASYSAFITAAAFIKKALFTTLEHQKYKPETLEKRDGAGMQEVQKLYKKDGIDKLNTAGITKATDLIFLNNEKTEAISTAKENHHKMVEKHEAIANDKNSMHGMPVRLIMNAIPETLKTQAKELVKGTHLKVENVTSSKSQETAQNKTENPKGPSV